MGGGKEEGGGGDYSYLGGCICRVEVQKSEQKLFLGEGFRYSNILLSVVEKRTLEGD